MFDLEKRIAQWRQQMSTAGLEDAKILDELETHLREQFAMLAKSGMSEDEAFHNAASRLGRPDSLKREFRKLHSGLGNTDKVALTAWGLVALLLAWFIGVKIFREGKDVTLEAHVFAIATGYLAALTAGGFAICQLLGRVFNTFAFLRSKSFVSTIVLFYRIAAVLVLAGVALAMIWEKSFSGHFFAGDLKEVGGICVGLWLTSIALIQWRRRIDEHDLLLAAIGGNIAVNLAWFGTGLMEKHLQGYGPGGLLLAWGIALNFACLLLGIVSRNPGGWNNLRHGGS